MGLSKRLINLIFGISISVLFMLIVFTYSRLSTFRTYADFISHSLAVQNDILAMRSSYRSLIANQRSFLLTKEEPYYLTFQEEKDSLRHTVDHFRRLTKTNKVHQTNIARLENNVNKRIQSLLVEIINDSSSAKYKYPQQELIARNQELNQDFTITVNALYNYEQKLMNQQLEIKNYEEKLTPLLMLLTALLAVGVIGYSFYLISKELKHRQVAEALLKTNIEQLNRSNLELEQYAYVASHDLQEPLRKIRTFSNRLVLKYKELLPEEAQDILARIDKSSSRMTLLINDLLTLSRLLSDKPDFKKIDLNQTLADIKENFAEEIEAQNVTIETSALPLITGSNVQIYQLFHNLFSNALKFAKPDIALKLVVNYSVVTQWESEEEYKYHQITFRDNGVGFDNSYVDKMFAIFGRLSNTKHIRGTGIGLSICNRIMQLHQGQLQAQGQIGEGATFTLLFPFELNES